MVNLIEYVEYVVEKLQSFDSGVVLAIKYRTGVSFVHGHLRGR